MSNARVTQDQLIGMIRQSLLDVSKSFMHVDVEGREEDPDLLIITVCRAAQIFAADTALAAAAMGVVVNE